MFKLRRIAAMPATRAAAWRICGLLAAVLITAGSPRTSSAAKVIEGVAKHYTAGDMVQEWGVAGLVEHRAENMVPMRDGVRLSTDVFLPKHQTGPFPVILVRLPYPKALAFHANDGLLEALVENGYAIVVQNERGTYGSEGVFHFLGGARSDGYDTIDWIIRQPWSTGKVGTYGCSSSAENQMPLSAENHPAHRAMIAKAAGAGIGRFPGITSQGMFYKGGGVPYLEFVPWYYTWGAQHRPHLPSDLPDDERRRVMLAYAKKTGELNAPPLAEVARHLPTRDLLRKLGAPTTDWDTFVLREPGDPAWQSAGFLTEQDRPRVPAIYMTSWYDNGTYEVIKAFEHQQARAANQFLIVSPTQHCAMGYETAQTRVGARNMGDARYDYQSLYLDWFDYWLKDRPSEVLSRPKVAYYLPPGGGWRSESRWPPVSASQKWYLGSDGHANTAAGGGTLTTDLVSRANADVFRYDPADPVPTYGGGLDGNGTGAIAEQSVVESRDDVLVYTSEPLAKPLDIAGEIRARLYVSTSVRDTDLTLRVADVYPDGRSFNVADTILRLRYRNGVDKPELMQPGEVAAVDMPALITAFRFAAGHRIRIQISSSNFPLYARNLNGGGITAEETLPIVATTRIYHDRTRASFVELPVLNVRSTAANSASTREIGR